MIASTRIVVDAVSSILDNINPKLDWDPSTQELIERLQDALSNLVYVARNHGRSYGLNPIKLLDDAASHGTETARAGNICWCEK
jgi:hypothetical protein